MVRVLGVDVAKKHWVAVADDLQVYAHLTLAGVLAAADADGPVAVVGVDIPIGLAHEPRARQADLLAHAVVGPRWHSVFMTPPRAVLTLPTYDEASAEARRTMGKGISQQAWALRGRILEVDRLLPTLDRRVVEVHPEVSFAALAGRFLTAAKSTWAGLEDRRALLDGAGLLPPPDVGGPGVVAGADDVLDAAVACWSAARVAAGTAVAYPDPPEQLDGVAASIWA